MPLETRLKTHKKKPDMYCTDSKMTVLTISPAQMCFLKYTPTRSVVREFRPPPRTIVDISLTFRIATKTVLYAWIYFQWDHRIPTLTMFYHY